MEFIKFLDTHAGSLTLIATVVYVIATCFICWANIKSARTSKAQVNEMQRQFYAVNRPNITPTIEYINRAYWVLRFTNCGNHTAFNVCIELDATFIDGITEEPFKENLRKNNGRICSIGANQHYDLFIGSSAYRDVPNKPPVKGIVNYRGINSSIYAENFEFDTNNFVIFFSTASDEEKLRNKIDSQTDELKKISNNLSLIASEIKRSGVNK